MYLILYQVVGSKEVILLFFSFSYFSFSAPGNHHMAITRQRLPFVHKLQACCSGIDQQSESWQKKKKKRAADSLHIYWNSSNPLETSLGSKHLPVSCTSTPVLTPPHSNPSFLSVLFRRSSGALKKPERRQGAVDAPEQKQQRE